jgi:hypothetical protein
MVPLKREPRVSPEEWLEAFGNPKNPETAVSNALKGVRFFV